MTIPATLLDALEAALACDDVADSEANRNSDCNDGQLLNGTCVELRKLIDADVLCFGAPRDDPAIYAFVAPGLYRQERRYAIGFVVRPLGGLVLGTLGDRIGRKPVLILTVTLMGLSTMLIGLLPNFQAIGYWAPALLIVLRIVQSLGG